MLQPDNVELSVRDLQKYLRNNIISLYKKLLLYQMKTVCLHSRSQSAVILRDLVKLDDWKAQITSVEKETEKVVQSIAQFRDEEISARLRSLDNCLRGVRTDLQSISAAVQNLGIEQRRRHDGEKDASFLNDLYAVDSRLEKAAIEELKGGLVEEAHELLVEQTDFHTVRQKNEEGLLWITGGPGRGKTMFLCGVINELLRRKREIPVLSYYFCRADRQSARTARSVLRGLLWLICDQSWGLTRRLREEYTNQGSGLFNDDDAIVAVALEKMLASCLAQPTMQHAVFVIDAIDECDAESIPVLLRVIGRLARDHPAQWIISSRSWETYRRLVSSIAPQLQMTNTQLDGDVVGRAVQVLVTSRVKRLASIKGYNKTLHDEVHDTLRSKAGDTFLWVALVCLELEGVGVANRHVRNVLNAVPKGLNGLYQRMLTAALDSADSKLCRQILPLACIVSQPLTIAELRCIVPELVGLSGPEVTEVVGNCGAFLRLQGSETNEASLIFIHESAREFLAETAREAVFSKGIVYEHRVVFTQTLNNIKTSRRNIYNLPHPGIGLDEITPPRPDPISNLRYSCLYWLDHARYLHCEGEWLQSDDEVLVAFIMNDLLRWLEVVALTGSVPQVTAGFQQLAKSYRMQAAPGTERVRGPVEAARRFILYNKTCIEKAPLQVYWSALLF